MAAKRKPPPGDLELVIVESPAKARTITRFLGEGYRVEASLGHVRDLPEGKAELPPSQRTHPHARLGVDVDNGFEPLYVVPPDKRKRLQEIKTHLRQARTLWLATDEDREGESISWHLLEVLKPPAHVAVKRLVFNEITRTAIQEALAHPREIDMDLVRAQESRRILDRLYGYEVSPVLWRKIKKGLSAGRVQSVALRLLVDRERERMAFVSAPYWDLLATLHTPAGESFEATLTHVGEQRVAQGRDFDPATGRLIAAEAATVAAGSGATGAASVVVLDETRAKALARAVAAAPVVVREVEEKPFVQRPPPPFTTSTLQQEAGRKLRFAAQRTMRAAQQLYENGCITYMRTDSTVLSNEGLEGARAAVRERFGPAFVPDRPRQYETKVRNAQEAHEAIRPAGASFLEPGRLPAGLGEDAVRLYELVYQRTLASQMPDARGRRVVVRLDGAGETRLRAAGQTIEFPGFRKVYVEDRDEGAEREEAERVLPALQPHAALRADPVEARGHATQPPPRYTEASLVKELDQRGIGRPSTWASIIQVLLDREYAFKRGTALVASFTAFAVVRLLQAHFGDLLDYEFTARMEDELDAVSRGEVDSREYLRRFYRGNGSPGLAALVARGLDEASPKEICRIPIKGATEEGIEVRVGRYGLFVTDGKAIAALPDDIVPDEFDLERAKAALAEAARGPQPLGVDPGTDLPVYLMHGRFGHYVQLGESPPGGAKAKGEKPKRASLLRGMDPEAVTLDLALRLLSLPRDLGPHPDQPDGPSIQARTGPYGPYVTWGKETRSIPPEVNVLEISLDQAVALLREPKRGRSRSAPKALRELGPHPAGGAPIRILSGRYGPYVSDGKVNATLPKGTAPEAVTLEQALEWLAAKAARGPARRRRTRKS